MNAPTSDIQNPTIEAQILSEAVGDLMNQRDAANRRAIHAERAICEMSMCIATQHTHHRETDSLRLGDSVLIACKGVAEYGQGHVFALPDCLDTNEPLIVVKSDTGELWVCKPEAVSTQSSAIKRPEFEKLVTEIAR